MSLPGNPSLPPGCTSADIDRGCLADGLIHCIRCGDVCADNGRELCDSCKEKEDEAMELNTAPEKIVTAKRFNENMVPHESPFDHELLASFDEGMRKFNRRPREKRETKEVPVSVGLHYNLRAVLAAINKAIPDDSLGIDSVIVGHDPDCPYDVRIVVRYYPALKMKE